MENKKDMENKKNIFKALAEFQYEIPIIVKDTQGYGYVYADLPSIIEVIRPFLKKHNLGFTQQLEGGSIKTIVFHTESGETIESVFEIPKNIQLKGMNDFQVLGSAVSYFRRYMLSASLGLVTDKDNDGAGEQIQKKLLSPNTYDWNNAITKKVDIATVKKHYSITKINEEAYLNELTK